MSNTSWIENLLIAGMNRRADRRTVHPIIQQGYELIDAAVAAGELPNGGSYLGILGSVSKRIGDHVFNGKQISLSIHPVIKRIATFEPSEIGSERPKDGDFIPLHFSWWALLDSNQ